jgi:hypothetical protein
MEGGNKSNRPIQNPLLLFTEPRTRDNLVSEVVMNKIRDDMFNKVGSSLDYIAPNG